MLKETFQTLNTYAKQYDAVIVSYSDGKDSRAVMDLCLRSFKRVEAFFMYLVPGLECVELGLAQAEKQWGVKIRQYPHWIASRYIRDGVYCHPSWERDNVRPYKLAHVYALAMADTNARLIATGQKKSDSASRRRLMTFSKRTDILHVIAEWNKYDVLSYMQMRGIPKPPSTGDTAGIDLTPRALNFLYETFPADFKRLCEYFPFAEAAVWRKRFYGK